MIVEISYGIDAPTVTQTVYQEIAFGRPVSPSERIGPPPEGVAREMMGYTALVETRVARIKHVAICARANRTDTEESPAPEAWRVHASIDNESGDLRGHLPTLFAAAMDYIGRTTDGETSFTMKSDDEAIRFVQRGM